MRDDYGTDLTSKWLDEQMEKRGIPHEWSCVPCMHNLRALKVCCSLAIDIRDLQKASDKELFLDKRLVQLAQSFRDLADRISPPLIEYSDGSVGPAYEVLSFNEGTA